MTTKQTRTKSSSPLAAKLEQLRAAKRVTTGATKPASKSAKGTKASVKGAKAAKAPQASTTRARAKAPAKALGKAAASSAKSAPAATKSPARSATKGKAAALRSEGVARGAARPAQRKPETRKSLPKSAPKGSAVKSVKRPERDPSREDALFIAELGLEKKAEKVLLLDVRGLTSFADYFVLMTAQSDPQLSAIADHLVQGMKKRGEQALGVEGLDAGQWVLIDFGHIVVHLFYKETREFYDIEGLWADAPRSEIRD